MAFTLHDFCDWKYASDTKVLYIQTVITMQNTQECYAVHDKFIFTRIQNHLVMVFQLTTICLDRLK